jgi:hypothetical protein
MKKNDFWGRRVNQAATVEDPDFVDVFSVRLSTNLSCTLAVASEAEIRSLFNSLLPNPTAGLPSAV